MNLLVLFEDRPFVISVLIHYFIFMLLYVLIRIGWILLQSGKRNNKSELKYFCGMLYINFVLALTMTPLHLTADLDSIISRIQLVPFDTVSRYWPMDGEYSIYNIIGNILMMFPILPILTSCFNVKYIRQAFIFTVFFTVSIELLQLILTSTRAFDVDDIILNIGGFLVSALLWKLFKSIKIAK